MHIVKTNKDPGGFERRQTYGRIEGSGDPLTTVPEGILEHWSIGRREPERAATNMGWNVPRSRRFT